MSKLVQILHHSEVLKQSVLYALLDSKSIKYELVSFRPKLLENGWKRPEVHSPLIVLGGPVSVYEADQNPWLYEEFDFVAKALYAGHRMYGICLGGQILAKLLGGEVKKSPAPEIGWHPIEVLPEAASYGFTPGAKHFFEWHYDHFTIPKDCVPLMTGTTCINQGFGWKDQALALQFHPEMCLENASILFNTYPDQVSQDKVTHNLKKEFCLCHEEAKKDLSTSIDWLVM